MTEAVALREASTIMVLRDGANGIEVLMLRRNLSSGWVGGMHLFPGGAVDAEDRAPAMAELCRGFDDREASRLLGTREGGLGYFVAAVRECFEEAGVLLASPAGSPSAVSFVDPAVERRFIEHRRLLNKGEAAFSSICQREGLQLDLARLGYISHWITPAGSPRRYDTRFLVARMPPGQEALHDDVEV
ncbi:MAG: NUDIX hydrolase, partial [Acidimicrobiales bacterium]